MRVRSSRGRLVRRWVDATGVALGVNGSIVENVCWLRPINDPRHINLAKLDVVIKGVNLAFQWHARVLHVVTNSACVHRWVSDTLTGKARLNTKAVGKMLVRLRLGTLQALVELFELTMDITLVKSCQNCTDSLTRVPQRWLDLHKKWGEPMPESCAAVTSRLSKNQVADIHQKRGHMGVKRTLYFARIIDQTMSKELVKSVVSTCETWQSIDPKPVRWEKRRFEREEKLAMDVTLYNEEHFLSHIDYGPSRFATVVPPGHCDGKTPLASLVSWKRFFMNEGYLPRYWPIMTPMTRIYKQLNRAFEVAHTYQLWMASWNEIT